MLLASLLCCMGVVKAQPKEGQLYFIKNVATGFYLDVTSTQTGGIVINELSLSNLENQCFYFLKAEGSEVYKIKSQKGQYVARVASSLWDMCATDAEPTDDSADITLVSTGEEDGSYYLQTTSTASWGNNVAPNNDCGGAKGSSVFSDKAQNATYVKWLFDEATEEKIEALKQQAIRETLESAPAAIAEVKATVELLIEERGTLFTEEQKTSMNDAVKAAEDFYAGIDLENPTIEDVEGVDAAINAIHAAVNAVIYVWSIEQLSNNLCYTVSTFDRGAWYSEDEHLNGTQKVSAEYDFKDVNQQFAFLKSAAVNYYRYSVAKGKFVSVSGNNTALTADPIEKVSFLQSTGGNKADYPWVIALGDKPSHLGISGNYTPSVISFWNDLSDGGNMVRIEVAAAVDLAAAIESVNAYEIEAAKEEVAALIAQADEIAKKEYIADENKMALNNAMTAAQAVCDKDDATYAEVMEQFDALTVVVNAAAYVTTVDGFRNNVVYTFVSKRGDNAYMMYDGTNDFVASQFKQTELTVGEDVENCQWAVYTSEAGYHYMYNLGAKKFMGVENAGNTGIPFSATPQTTGLTFKVGEVATHPILISANGGAGAVNHSNVATFTNNNGVVNWDGGFGYTSDAGNVHKVTVVGLLAEETLATIASLVAKFEVETAKAELAELIAEAKEIAKKSYVPEEAKTALNNAVATAQTVCDKADATYAEVVEQLEVLTETVNAAAYVTTVDGFKNTAIYTFVSNRSETAYLMYDGTNDFVASQYMQTGLAVGEDVVNCQWAVYTSEAGYHYMYNLGAKKFMGVENAGNTGIPFSATPQTTGLTFKVGEVATHPILISANGGAGAVNHSNVATFTNNNGVVNWNTGFDALSDAGNVHKVTIVGELDESTLTTIANAVALFEPRALAVQDLDEYLKKFYANYYDAYNEVWRNAPGVNNYSQPKDDQPLDKAYEEVKAYFDAITGETAVDEIKAKLAYLKGLEANLTINQPEAGKFYRLRCVDGKKYLQSTVNEENNRLTMSTEVGPAAIFYYVNGGLLSYTVGQYIDHREFKAVGESSVVTFSAAVNGIGCYNVKVGDSYHIFGKNDDIDSGSGTPDDRAGYNWWLEEVTSLPVAINTAYGYATLTSPVALSTYKYGSTTERRVNAYTGALDGDVLKLTRVDNEDGIIPANTPVVIEYLADAENGYVFLQIVDSDKEAVESDLVGTTAAEAKGNKNAYTLQGNAEKNGAVFKKYTGANLVGFKAYLDVDTAAAAISIRKDEADGTTGVESVLNVQPSTAIYDLTGRRVEKMERGIYIVNGRKVIVK